MGLESSYFESLYFGDDATGRCCVVTDCVLLEGRFRRGRGRGRSGRRRGCGRYGSSGGGCRCGCSGFFGVKAYFFEDGFAEGAFFRIQALGLVDLFAAVRAMDVGANLCRSKTHDGSFLRMPSHQNDMFPLDWRSMLQLTKWLNKIVRIANRRQTAFLAACLQRQDPDGAFVVRSFPNSGFFCNSQQRIWVESLFIIRIGVG